MTPPNDAARPVAKILGYRRGGSAVMEWTGKPVAPGTLLYTAADYGALRAERDELARICKLREGMHHEIATQLSQAIARAEAAEARIWKAETELNDWQADVEDARKSKLRTTYSIAAVQKMIDDFRAALNEGGE